MIKLFRDNSDNKEFNQLIQLLDEELNSRYGIVQTEYDVYNKIKALDTVVIGYVNNVLAGCGCYKFFDSETVEIKRMFVKPEFRGSGIAKMILNELEQWAIENGFSKSILETGIRQPEAIKFYTKQGYHKIGNYGQYIGNSNSVCMSKKL